MKKLLTLSFLSVGLVALGQTVSENYVKTVTARQATNSSIINSNDNNLTKQFVQYYDGLGKPLQSVARWGSPNEKDLVTHIKYDALGRKEISYLPYEASQTTGNFRTNAIYEQLVDYHRLFPTNYDGDNAYEETVFEPSPLNRPVAQYAPGSGWSRGFQDKPITTSYETNTVGEVSLWYIDLEGFPTRNTAYTAGTLYKTVTKDEDRNETRTYTNKLGQTIMKESYTGSQWAQTYYVYDDLGNLRYVLPPEFIAWTDVHGVSQSNAEFTAGELTLPPTNYANYYYGPSGSVRLTDGFTHNSGTSGTFIIKPGRALSAIEVYKHSIYEYCFEYTYDERDRMISKKVPGAETIYMVYDARDRLVLTQDGEQRKTNQWLFTKYDKFNRPIVTGITSGGSEATERANVMNENGVETYNGSGTTKYTTNGAYPTSGIDQYLTVTFYDNYDFVAASDLSGTNYQQVYTPSSPPDPWLVPTPTIRNDEVKGQVTGTLTGGIGSDFITTITYYDEKYRPSQIVSENHLHANGKDVISNQYDFVGNVRKTQTAHFDGSTTTTVERTFDYDHMDRLLSVTHKIDDETPVTLLENSYDELGQLVTKELHSPSGGDQGEAEQTLDYSYNIRGWLTSINNSNLTGGDLFGMELYYNTSSGLSGHENRYNGNIAAMRWSNYDFEDGGISTRAYEFDYDGLNRLTDANHFRNNASNTEYGVDIPNYDLNGNIQNLTRKGKSGSNIDNLTYTYLGNQLQKVTDGDNNAEGFDNGSSGSGTDYAYDHNGNMVSDANKGITDITYNHLNLPTKVTFDASNYIEYQYDAAGIKLQQKVTEGGSIVKTTDYVGEFIYENQHQVAGRELQLIQHEEGRIIPLDPSHDEYSSTKKHDYQYHLKDHLGNVRVTFSTTPEVFATIATMESGSEASSFNNYTAESVAVAGEAHGGTHVSRNSNTSNNGVDLNVMLSVNKGDVINASAYAWYNASGSTFTPVVGSIAGYLFNNSPAGVVAEGVSFTQNVFDQAFVDAAGLANKPSSSTSPNAYINYIFFDRDMQYIASGYEPITTASKNNSTQISITPYTADQDGYILVYLSNETGGSALSISWDDFEVSQTKTNIVSTQDYYPFGLTFNESVRTASEPQRFKYNSFEYMDDLNLNLYDYQARQYDPAIGRFTSIDPLSEVARRWSPYAYAYNNPIRFIDPDGMEAEDWVKKEDPTIEWDGEKDQDPKEKTTNDLTKALNGKTVQDRLDNVVDEFEEGDFVTTGTVHDLTNISEEKQDGEGEGKEGVRDVISQIDKIEKTENGFVIKSKTGEDIKGSIDILNKDGERAMSLDIVVENNAEVNISQTKDGGTKVNLKGVRAGKGFLKAPLPSITIKENDGKLLGVSFPLVK